MSDVLMELIFVACTRPRRWMRLVRALFEGVILTDQSVTINDESTSDLSRAI